MEHQQGCCEVWEELVTIPTYGVGKPDKNPMFLEKRVYQGSSGKVYPLPVIDRIEDEKHDQTYRAVFLENDYIRVMVLPELGGRIQRAYDKTNDYDFVYYNEVIKPALVGLTGPWISGGIEFNWPQHHRPTTFAPVDYLCAENPDGSKTVRLSEVDQMYGTKGMMSFTVYPDKAYIEIKGQLYNRTPLPQTFLWWANPAVPVNDDTQSIFPPDVTAVYDHGKRDVSKFPIATGVYYKHDYGRGVDISRYKNIPVPTSYMAYRSEYNFVGGYDYGKQAGILHIADHHISPGKKQWTWGCGDFGKAWDRNLTDHNGPYIELMTGVYTDNQPDFTWLMPFEEKTFTQYFMPYKAASNVKNASTEAVINLEVVNGSAQLTVYATAVYHNARIVLTQGEDILSDTVYTISPMRVYKACVPVSGPKQTLALRVYDASGRLMIGYQAAPDKIEKLPEPAAPAKAPEEILTNEELYFTAQHIEQYRHATFEPDPYYLEGLKRDAGDSRINTAYGLLLLRRGQFDKSEAYFRRAIERITARNPNPACSQAYYALGLSLFYQERHEEAFDAFYKATWSAAEQEMAFYYLAVLASRQGDTQQALEFVERALVKNSRNIKARALKGLLLTHSGRDAHTWLLENIAVDPFDYLSGYLLARTGHRELDDCLALMGTRVSSYIEAACDCGEAGFDREADELLALCPTPSAMLWYYRALYTARFDPAAVPALLEKAAAADALYCFPNRLEDIAALRFAIAQNPADAKAPYYLGNLFYDKKQYALAQSLWEASASLDASFPTVWRNLSLVYFNKCNQPAKALDALEKAFALDPSDARVFLELDQLHRKLGMAPAARLSTFEAHMACVNARDDLYVEYVTLLNLLGRHEEAYRHIMNRRFHPWEGGEGKVTTQYTTALTQMARACLHAGDVRTAVKYLQDALCYPENLGEGKLEGEKDNHIYYGLGVCYRLLGDEQKSHSCFSRASEGDNEPAGMMYYNDQPADMILYQGLAYRALGNEERAHARFNKLKDYGEKHIYDTVRIDYFAVSLPDLQLFEDDLQLRNRAHCCYLIALGSYGLGDLSEAAAYYNETLSIDPAHMGATLHQRLLTAPPAQA